MTVILWIIAGILILAGLAILGALCTPLRISAKFDTRARPAFAVDMAAFGGLLPVYKAAKRPGGPARKAKRRTKSRSRTSTRENIMVYAPRMLRDGPRLVSRIAGRVKFEGLDADISFGLPDPADTGMVYGALTPVTHLLGAAEHSHVTLHPDFDNIVFDGRGHIAARFTPVTLIPPILSFAWTAIVSPRLSGGIG